LPSITAEDVVKLFEGDVRARKRLAELLISEPDVRLAVINAVIRDVATKSDVEALRRELREEMGRLDKRIDGLDQRVARLEGSISLFTKLFVAFNLPLLVSVIAALVVLLLRAL